MKRTKGYVVRLSNEELAEINAKVASTGLSREQYTRMVLRDQRPVQLPTDEFIDVIRELRKIGTNINQIAHKANMNEDIDKKYYQSNFDQLMEQIDMIILMMGEAALK